MKEVKETGGARIGLANATWPFATLSVSPEKLELKATILGDLVFRPSDVISIEPYSGLMSGGLKINHRVSNYKDHVVFWTFKNRAELIKKIEQTGFLTNANPIAAGREQEIKAAQANGGFPIKTTVAIAIGVVWNILFLFDIQRFFANGQVDFPLGIGAQLALGFILSTCVLLLTSKTAGRMILKEGRSVDDFKLFLFLVMFFCGFMLLGTILVGIAQSLSQS